MALYDQRVFRHRGSQWAAEVHGEGGPDGDAPEQNSVYFTRIGVENEPSRRAVLPAGTLNRLSHHAIGRLLDAAKVTDFRMPSWPFNRGDVRDYPGSSPFVDDEGLRWVVRDATALARAGAGYEAVPAVQVICLDDSALRKDIGFSGTTREDIRRMHGGILNGELVKLVKGSFEELEHEYGGG